MIRNFIRQSRPWTHNIETKITNKNYIEYSNELEASIKKIPIKELKSYSIKDIVKDYNERWNKNVTIEEYLKEFTRKHRGAC